MKKLLIITALLLIVGVSFGQSLKKGTVLGTHAISVVLNPDVTLNQYLDFMNNKLKPEFEKNFPGVQILVLKGTRGENKNGIGMLYVVESVEVRDKYWPKDGESSEIAKSALEKMQATMEEWAKMEVDFSTKYTDWIIQ